MTTLRYSFRPNLFRGERTVALDNAGIVVREGTEHDRRVGWNEITDVHLEPGTAGDDDKPRWVLNLRLKTGKAIQIDSVNVRGAADFEHKTDEFLTVLDAVHTALAPRGDRVRFRVGMRSGVVIAWRIALFLVFAVGVVGMVAAFIVEDYATLISAGVFVAFGGAGLLALKGKGGPKPYKPDEFIAARSKPS